MTLSRPLAGADEPINEVWMKRMRTIETADNGLLLVPLLDHDFDVRVCTCKVLELGEEKGACVLG
jgi:hypothetical protein